MEDSKSSAQVGDYEECKTISENSHKNEAAERINMSFLKRARSMQIHASLLK